MKAKVIVVLILALLVCIYVAVMKCRENQRLRGQVDELRMSKLDLLKDEYEPAWSWGGCEEPNVDVISVYDDIVMAYTNQDLQAMRDAISMLPNATCQRKWQAVGGAERHFLSILNESFLRLKVLLDFETVEEFERYAGIGVEAARFYGESNIRRKSCEIPIAVEYWTLDVLKKYSKKFHEQGRNDLESAADRYLRYWIARIEGPDGLTRQCAWHALKYNTIYIGALKPERALTEEQGILLARQTAIGLVRCGYRPKWVEVDFPLPKGAGKTDPLKGL